MLCFAVFCYVNSFDCIKFLITRFTILDEKSGKNIKFVIFFGVTWMRSWVIFIPIYRPRENSNMLVAVMLIRQLEEIANFVKSECRHW